MLHFPLPPSLPPPPLQRLPDVVNMEELSRKDLAAEPSKMEQLAAENQALQSRITALHEEASRGAKGKGRGAEKEELLAEISRLRDLAQSASKVRETPNEQKSWCSATPMQRFSLVGLSELRKKARRLVEWRIMACYGEKRAWSDIVVDTG